MPNALDTIRTFLRSRPKASADQLAANLDLARKAEAVAVAGVERHVKLVADGFLDDDAIRAKARTALSEARNAAEDATAIRTEVERRHVAAAAATEQGRRLAVYEGAKAQTDAAALSLAKTYPKLCAGLLALLKDLATAQLAVVAANAALPDGAMPLNDPEMMARADPGLPKQIVKEEEVELWGHQDLQTPVADAFQRNIHDYGQGWGKYVGSDRGELSLGDLHAPFRMRRFRKITYRDGTSGTYPTPLAAALQLPNLRGDFMAFGEDFPAYNPALGAVMMGHAEPAVVLARLSKAEIGPAKADRPLKVEWELLGDVTPLPVERPIVDTISRRGQSGTGRFGASPFAPSAPTRAGRR